MIINMGPQHPSTHGVLRLMLELQGETVLRCKPIIGYLHTGMEKTGEALTYLQGGTNVTRMDYLSPFFNELAFSMATEQLLGIDQDIPERAVWIRMLMSELNRMSSHLLFLATNGMDLGAVSMMIYGWREREEVLRFFQKVTGLRMNHNYIRPGGVAADLPARLARRRAAAARPHPAPSRRVRHPDDRPADLARAAAGRRRDHADRGGGARRRPARCCGRPVSTGTSAAGMPYLRYPDVEFDVIVGTYGDAFDRYAIRLNEVRESMRIVHQVLDRMPERRLPDPGQEGHAATAGPHRRVDGGADPPLQDLHRGVQGPRGRGVRRRREPPRRARLLHRQRRRGQAVPHARAGAVVREHPVPAAHDARRSRRRRRGDHLLGRSRPRGRRPVTGEAVGLRRRRAALARGCGGRRGLLPAVAPRACGGDDDDTAPTTDAPAETKDAATDTTAAAADTTAAAADTTTAGTAATTAPVEGFTFTSPYDDFTIVFPEEPTDAPQTVDLPDGTSLPVEFWVYESATARWPRPASSTAAGTEVSLAGRGGRRRRQRRRHAHVERADHAPGPRGHPTAGRGARPAPTSPRSTPTALILYQLIAAVSGDASFDDPEAEAFFGSFQFTEDG